MGRSHPVKQSPDRPARQTSSGITDHRSGISGHFRAFPDMSGYIRTRDGRRVPYRPSPVTPSCMACRCGIVRRRARRGGRVIACRITSRRTRHEGRSSRAVSSVAGSRAVAPVAGSRIVTSLCVSATPVSLPCSRSGEPHARRRPCERPNSACSRRRHRRYTNVYSYIMPWRFIGARSAARLRRTVGPFSRHGSCRTGEPLTLLRYMGPNSPGITGHNRA